MRSHTFVQFPDKVRPALRWDHSSPTITSSARVAANIVKSIVRPANWIGRVWGPLVVSTVTFSINAELFFDCKSCRLNHAATNVESHVVNLQKFSEWSPSSFGPNNGEGQSLLKRKLILWRTWSWVFEKDYWSTSQISFVGESILLLGEKTLESWLSRAWSKVDPPTSVAQKVGNLWISNPPLKIRRKDNKKSLWLSSSFFLRDNCVSSNVNNRGAVLEA